jgi:hypothetical protein
LIGAFGVHKPWKNSGKRVETLSGLWPLSTDSFGAGVFGSNIRPRMLAFCGDPDCYTRRLPGNLA